MNAQRCVALLIVVSSGAIARSQTPLSAAFTYQGRLESAGQPVHGAADFSFKLFDSAAAGTLLGTQTLNAVAVADGLFTVTLNPAGEFGANVFNGDKRWLEISVDGTPLSPRQELTAAPYALQTRGIFVGANGHVGIGTNNPTNMLSVHGGGLSVFDGLDEDVVLTTNRFQLSNRSNEDPAYVYTYSPDQHDFFTGGFSRLTIAPSGNVGIGTSNPATSLEVVGTAKVTASASVAFDVSNASTLAGAMAVRGIETGLTGNTYGIFGVSNSTAGIGVLGRAAAGTGTSTGVYGHSLSTTGHGVYGAATAASGINYGVYGTSASPFGVGVLGESVDNVGVRGNATGSTGTNYGVYGVSSSTGGYGVAGAASATTGTNIGGYFLSYSDAGKGVYGFAVASSGDTYGVYGRSESSNGTGVYGLGHYGVEGSASGSSGAGVRGSATGGSLGSGVGVSGVSSYTSGAGVFGYSSAASGYAWGVQALGDSPGGGGVLGVGDTGVDGSTYASGGIGVAGYAYNTASTTYGGRFQSDSPTGRGVYGYASTTGAATTPYGVRGQASTGTAGYAVYATGDMGASGVKPFRIDHPDDPENKYLLHYAAESPEVINFYRGTVLLDAAGEAVVELPPYFARINKTPSYQLTAVGAAMPDLHIAQKISESEVRAGAQAQPGEAAPLCSFRIAGGAPGGEVSWRVEAVRNDLRMRLYGAPVERDKEGLERGKYQHPEYYGQPPERGMDFDAERARRSPPSAPPEDAPLAREREPG